MRALARSWAPSGCGPGPVPGVNSVTAPRVIRGAQCFPSPPAPSTPCTSPPRCLPRPQTTPGGSPASDGCPPSHHIAPRSLVKLGTRPSLSNPLGAQSPPPPRLQVAPPCTGAPKAACPSTDGQGFLYDWPTLEIKPELTRQASRQPQLPSLAREPAIASAKGLFHVFALMG